MKQLIVTLALLVASLGATAQSRKFDKLTVEDNLQYKGGEPLAPLQLMVSRDGNGNAQWMFFTVFQDSVNQGIYDTIIVAVGLFDSLTAIVGNFDSIIINASPAIPSGSILAGVDRTYGGGTKVVPCAFGCDTIQNILDRLDTIGGGDYSPWDSTATAIVQKDTTLDVGVGVSTPTALLDVVSNVPVTGTLKHLFSISDTTKEIYFRTTKAPNGNRILSLMPVVGLNGSGLTLIGTGSWPILQARLNSFLIESSGTVGTYGSQLRIVDDYIEMQTTGGNVGIGVTSPPSKLTVSQGDIYITDIGDGIIIPSPDGTCWRLTPDNTGASVWTSITCPTP